MKRAVVIILLTFVFSFFVSCKNDKSCKEIIDAVDDGILSSSSEEALKCFDYAYDICTDWLISTKEWEKDRATQYCKEDPWRVL